MNEQEAMRAQQVIEESKIYWGVRQAKEQQKMTNRSIKDTEKLLKKTYKKTSDRIVEDFERVYSQILLAQKNGVEPTPADLYKLDKYWQLQNQVKFELDKLGDKSIKIMSRSFLNHFEQVYNSIEFEHKDTFTTMGKDAMKRAIDTIWCADDKTWSDRVWNDMSKLRETLQNELIHCVSTGKKTSELKALLQNRFGVAYFRADCIARTELAHIQSESARQRYKDYGITKMMVWAEGCQCDACKKIEEEKKIYSTSEATPVPVHPNCRCCIIPIIDD